MLLQIIAYGFAITTLLYDKFITYNNLTNIIFNKLDKIDVNNIQILEYESKILRDLIINGEFIEEDKKLITEFKSEMTLDEICNNHQRNIGGIASRLVRLNLINDRKEIEGYSDARKEQRKKNKIIKLSTESKLPTESKSIREKKITDNQREYINLQNNVKEIKQDVTELKESILQLTKMLKAIYEFEDS
jgi:hypothetical protein